MENFLRDSLINLLNVLLFFFATFNLHTEHMITEMMSDGAVIRKVSCAINREFAA